MDKQTRYTLLVIYAGLLVFGAWQLFNHVIGAFPLTTEQILPLVCFTVFIIGVEFFEFRAESGANWIPSATIDLAVWVTLGPAVAMIMEVFSVLLGDGLFRRRPLYRVMINLPALAISAGLAGLVYARLPYAGDLASPLFLAPALVSHLVFSATNMGLTSFALAIHQGDQIKVVLHRMFGWHFLSGILTTPIAAFLIFAYRFAGLWSLVLFGLPLYLIWQTHKMFQDLRDSHKSTVAALTTALEADEPYTHGHSYRVAQYAIQIGQRLKMSHKDLENLEYGGLLHDIGKIAITNDIVCKPSRLSKEEFDILASHPTIGREIVEQMKFLKEVAQLVGNHHERPDGLGYPRGLKGDEIALGSHILNLADAVDAMTSNRPYRNALDLEQAVQEVKRFRGTQFDARVVDTFEAMVNEGRFQLIDQADGAAQKIQQILRAAAAAEREKYIDPPAYAA